MTKYGYDARLATGALAVAGTLGALIPPSILMILYGMIAQVSIGSLFLGGAVVGVITALAYAALIMVRVKLNPALAPRVEEEVTWRMRFAAFRDVAPITLLIAVIFGGLFGGFFTPTEAGALGATFSTLIALATRSLTRAAFVDAIRETLMTTTTLFIIGCGAALLIRFLALSGAGSFLTDAVVSFGADPLMVILGIALIYLILGMFLEPIGAMLLTLPIVLPIVGDSGWSLVWFGVFLTKLLEIGMVTPPVGMNVFVIKGVVGDLIPLSGIFRGIVWFLAVDLVIGALLVLCPEIVTFLPALLG
ncbi:MAG: TRAP transporter large permease subunit [Pseudomonadota bacterium]|nr:TRAP transporter large permease subunit [Pseudomonadota bacterium]